MNCPEDSQPSRTSSSRGSGQQTEDGQCRKRAGDQQAAEGMESSAGESVSEKNVKLSSSWGFHLPQENDVTQILS